MTACPPGNKSPPTHQQDLIQDALDLATKIDAVAFKIALDRSVDPDVKLPISLKLVNSISNLSMGDSAEQNGLFRGAEQLKVHIKRPHFYSPIATMSELDDGLWDEKNDTGIKWDDCKTLDLLKELSVFAGDFERAVESGHWDVNNPAFGYHDSILYYCMIRRLQPAKIIEVGGGYSTQLASMAVNNGNLDTSITCIEPYPNDMLRGLDVRWIKKRVQDVDMREFDTLSSDDILFIDSSHVSKVDSDVNHLFLKVLPRLAYGVNVHIHDIFIPYEYPKHWIQDLGLFWNEQYLLHAFLIDNHKWSVTLPVGHIRARWPDRLESMFPSPAIGRGGSFWMEKKTGGHAVPGNVTQRPPTGQSCGRRSEFGRNT